MHLKDLADRLEQIEQKHGRIPVEDYVQLLEDLGTELLASAKTIREQLAAGSADWASPSTLGDRVKVAVVGPDGTKKQESGWL